MENNEAVSEVLRFAAIMWIPIARDTVDKQYRLVLCCRKQYAADVVYVGALDVVDDEGVDWVTVDVVDEFDDAEFDCEFVDVTDGTETDDATSHELVDVFALTADDDEVGNGTVALAARDVAAINYLQN